jgi:hypothetical protein
MNIKVFLKALLRFLQGRNILSLYLKVWLGYLFGFFVLMAILSIPLLFLSGGKSHLFSPEFFRNGFSGLLFMAAVSSFFSVLEVQQLGTGWFCYGLLLAGFIYFSYNQHQLWIIPEFIRSVWLPVLIIHPFMYFFAGGKAIERVFMTEEQREEAEILDEQWYTAQYEGLSFNEKQFLKKYGIHDADSYTEAKLGRRLR